MYVAIGFAGNNFFRSAFVSAVVLFAAPLFEELGITRVNSVLAAISIIQVLNIFTLYILSTELKGASKCAISDE